MEEEAWWEDGPDAIVEIPDDQMISIGDHPDYDPDDPEDPDLEVD